MITIFLCAIILLKASSTFYSFTFLKTLALGNNVFKENVEKDNFQLLNSKICSGNNIFPI